MQSVKFYQLRDNAPDKFLCLLLENYYNKGHRIVVRMQDSAAVLTLDKNLWIFSRRGFIPHATKDHSFLAEQPIYITDAEELPNNPDVLVLTKYPAVLPSQESLEQLILVFALDEEKSMKQLASQYSAPGINIIYYYQDLAGKWEKLDEDKFRN